MKVVGEGLKVQKSLEDGRGVWRKEFRQDTQCWGRPGSSGLSWPVPHTHTH